MLKKIDESEEMDADFDLGDGGDLDALLKQKAVEIYCLIAGTQPDLLLKSTRYNYG